MTHPPPARSRASAFRLAWRAALCWPIVAACHDGGAGPGQPPTNRIAFASTRTGDYEVFVMEADGTDQRNVSRDPAHLDVTPPSLPTAAAWYSRATAAARATSCTWLTSMAATCGG